MKNTTDPLDLASLEESTFRSRYDDGLLDLLAGLALLAMGLSIGTEMSGMAGVWAALIFPMWLGLRQRLIEPRTGYVEFAPERRAKLRRTQIILVLGGVFTLLGGVAVFVMTNREAGGPGIMKQLGPIPFAIALALPALIGALLLGVHRWFVHAGVIVGLVSAGHVLDLPFRLTLSTAGAIVLLIGVVILVRFLRAHPVPELNGHGTA